MHRNVPVSPVQGHVRALSDRVGQLRNEHDRQGLQIDADTAVTAWAGEVMDDAIAIEGLLQSDGVVLGAGSDPA